MKSQKGRKRREDRRKYGRKKGRKRRQWRNGKGGKGKEGTRERRKRKGVKKNGDKFVWRIGECNWLNPSFKKQARIWTILVGIFWIIIKFRIRHLWADMENRLCLSVRHWFLRCWLNCPRFCFMSLRGLPAGFLKWKHWMNILEYYLKLVITNNVAKHTKWASAKHQCAIYILT